MTREPQNCEQAYRRWRKAFYCDHHPAKRRHTRYDEFLWSAWSTKRLLRRLRLTPSERDLLICFQSDFKQMLQSECVESQASSALLNVLLLAIIDGYLQFTRGSEAVTVA